MELVTNAWGILTSHRMKIVALLVLLSLVAPHPAEGQFGFLSGLLGIITSGLNTLNGVMGSINNALRNVRDARSIP